MKFLTAIAATLFAASSANAGTLIVTGDSTIAFRQNSVSPTLAGNVAFARNILGGGTNVRIFGGPGVPDYTGQLVAGFNALGGGVTASAFSSAITADAIAGADLFVAFFPNRSFTADEAGVIRNFLFGGGTVFLGGEATTNTFGNPLGGLQNGRINELLTAIGSTISLNVGSFDPSDQFATLTAGEIVADPLTAGISSFGYGLTTTVSGGNALFLTNGLAPFVAFEAINAIPEPATWAMLIAGFGLVGAAARRRRPVVAA